MEENQQKSTNNVPSPTLTEEHKSTIKLVAGWLLITLGVFMFVASISDLFEPKDINGTGSDIGAALGSTFFTIVFLLPGMVIVQKQIQLKKNIVLGGVVTLFIFITFLIGGLVGTYNGLVYLNESFNQQAGNVRIAYQKRFEQLPALLEAAREPLKQEADIQGKLAEARNGITNAKNDTEIIKSTNLFDSALSRLMVLVEAYPQLRNTEEYQYMQKQITETNELLASERKVYNEQVKKYNLIVKGFPNNIIARMLGFQPKEYWSQAPNDQ